MDIRKTIAKHRADIYLFFTYLLFVAVIVYCYPCPQINGDGGDYVFVGFNLQPGVRAIGYSLIIRFLSFFSHSVYFITAAPFAALFLATIVFLRTISARLQINGWRYYVLGVLLLAEPTSLYYCIYILSDVFFVSFALLYLSTLLLYISKRQLRYFIFHVLLLIFCIEIRLAGLVFLVFSSLALLLFLKDIKQSFYKIAILLVSWFTVYSVQVKYTQRVYGSPVFSSFVGWNSANNALYIARHIKADPATIKDPETRSLFIYFSHFLDTSTYNPQPIKSDYLWDCQSPMSVYRKKWQDSCDLHDYYVTWARLAPLFGKYGRYVQLHFPREYIRWYIIPNMKSLLVPYNEEMSNYYIPRINTVYLPDQFHFEPWCRVQLYRDHLHSFNKTYYHIRAILLLISICLMAFFAKAYSADARRYVFLFGLFILLYVSLVLFSSWFIYRFLMPVFPLINVIIFIALSGAITHFTGRKAQRV